MGEERTVKARKWLESVDDERTSIVVEDSRELANCVQFSLGCLDLDFSVVKSMEQGS